MTFCNVVSGIAFIALWQSVSPVNWRSWVQSPVKAFNLHTSEVCERNSVSRRIDFLASSLVLAICFDWPSFAKDLFSCSNKWSTESFRCCEDAEAIMKPMVSWNRQRGDLNPCRHNGFLVHHLNHSVTLSCLWIWSSHRDCGFLLIAMGGFHTC